MRPRYAVVALQRAGVRIRAAPQFRTEARIAAQLCSKVPGSVTSLTDFELAKSESEAHGFGVQQIHIGVAGEKQMDFSAAVRTIKKTKSVESI